MLAALCLVGASASALAQTTPSQVQANANKVRDQLRASQLRQQQRQQSSDTLRKAFKSNQAQQGIDQADQASRDRSQSRERQQVEDYLHREQAKAAAHPASTGSQPAHATSSH